MSGLRERIAEVDASDQLGDVLALPDHVLDALWRFESAGSRPAEAAGLVVAGMGGSAIGAELARAALGDRLSLPLRCVRGYSLEPWTTPRHAVLCLSYSGDTEETLACFEAAEALGAPRYVATTGGALAAAARAAGVPVVGLPSGRAPRAAVGYGIAITAELAAAVGISPSIRTELDAAAGFLADVRESLLDRAGEIVDRLAGTIPLIAGCDLTVPLAYRWKTEINENAKLHAFSHELPELDHNEIVAWEGAGEAGRFSQVLLTDADQHPRERQRAELTAEAIRPHAADVLIVETEGGSRTARLLWGLMLGDLVSLGLAAARGVDPTPVPVLEGLKDRLGRP